MPYLIAQKLHACTEVFDDQENERVHDLMDLLLARDLLGPASLARTQEACQAIFANRAKQPWPPELIVYPSWAETYTAIAEEDGFPIGDVAEAAAQVRGFIEEIESSGAS